MLYGDGFWSGWLLEQAEDNRYEAEAFIGSCGSINCAKLRKAVIYSGVHKSNKRGKDGKLHRWWTLLNYLRAQTQQKILVIFAPKTQMWKIGARVGMVMGALNMRPEFFPAMETGNDHEPRPNYCWGEDLVYFPMRIEVVTVDGVAVPRQVPDLPKPLNPYKNGKMVKRNEWRDGCVFYGDKKAWKAAMGEPKAGDRWRKSGMRYHPVTGEPINVKKGQKKYPTVADLAAAHAMGVADEQAAGRLPSDAENASVAPKLVARQCTWQYAADN